MRSATAATRDWYAAMPSDTTCSASSAVASDGMLIELQVELGQPFAHRAARRAAERVIGGPRLIPEEDAEADDIGVRGQTLRGIRRHPTLGDDVTVYPGATILGGETVIGSGSVVNGNAYVTSSVPPNSRVVPEAPRQEIRRRGGDAVALDWDI